MKKCVKKFFSILMLMVAFKGFSQDGNAGIQAATTNLTGYFATGVTLMYATRCSVRAGRRHQGLPEMVSR